MEINEIIYDTTRNIYSVEDKLSIATIFIFCWKLSSKSFAELLYCDNHVKFIENLNFQYSQYEVDFTIRLTDKNIKDCFYKTLERVKEKYDNNGYYKALYQGDEFALVIDEIVNYSFDKVHFKQITQDMAVQLRLSL
jgi:hypothetical protein